MAVSACRTPLASGPPPRAEPADQAMARPGEARTLGPDPELVRSDILALLERRLGRSALERAVASADHILAVGTWGEFASGTPLNVLTRSPVGWRSWVTGEPRPIPDVLGQEIDRILADPDFWRERGAFSRYADCTGGAPAMIIRIAGRERVTRQVCKPSGLTGRLTQLLLES